MKISSFIILLSIVFNSVKNEDCSFVKFIKKNENGTCVKEKETLPCSICLNHTLSLLKNISIIHTYCLNENEPCKIDFIEKRFFSGNCIRGICYHNEEFFSNKCELYLE